MKQIGVNLFARELDEHELPNEFIDPFNIYSSANNKIKVWLSNPYLKSQKSVFQLLGIVDKTIAGTGYILPIELSLNGKIYDSNAAHNLLVNKNYRGCGLGSKITDARLDFCSTKSLVLCNPSQMQIPILKRLGGIILTMPRLVLVKNSISVIETKFKGNLAKPISKILDCGLKLIISGVKHSAKQISSRNISIEEYQKIPEIVNDIINKDTHPFKEIHNKDWFQWVKDNSLIENSSITKRFFLIKKNNEPIGFFMTKTEFYESASHRGYKNLTLGSVIEWQTINENILSTSDIMLLAIKSFPDDVDAIEICTDDSKTIKRLKCKGLIQVGMAHVVIRFRPDSCFNNIQNLNIQKNWRIRPSMGDGALS